MRRFLRRALASVVSGPGGSTLMAAVITDPASSARNVIQPVGDYVALTLRASQIQPQTQPLLEIQDSSGNILGAWNANGSIVSGASAAPADVFNYFTGVSTETAGVFVYGEEVAYTLNPAAPSSAILTSGYFATNVIGSQNNPGQIYGVRVLSQHDGTGTLGAGKGVFLEVIKNNTGVLSAAFGIDARIHNLNATGVITQGTCFRAQSPVLTGGITTSRGMVIDNQGGAGVTTAQGLLINTQSGAATTNAAIVTNGGVVQFGDNINQIGSRDAVQLQIKGFSTQTNNLFTILDSANLVIMSIGPAGGMTSQVRDAATNTLTTARTFAHNTTGTPAAGFGVRDKWQLETTTTEGVDAAMIDVSWVDATHATRKARAIYTVLDTSSRECWRAEASGTAPMLGFFGANAVVRQTGASAAGIAAIIDPNAAAAVGALQTALANLGFVTSPA